ncbi:aerobic cobalto chelatase subunit CobT [Roseomonas sp. TAS13]|nr:aerobic cobalto chelatase subunit CobT [Roseomonas sp. TAS13]
MSNSKDLSRQEEFKRATAGAVRAIARTDDVQVAFQPGPSGLTGKRARLPLPTRALPPAEMARLRGAADAVALKLRYHDETTHAARLPARRDAKEVFDTLEQARVEAVGSRAMPGVAANLQARLTEQAEAEGYDRMTRKDQLPLPVALGGILLTGLCALGMARVACRQVGGHTGDVLGACEQLAEAVVLSLLAASLGHWAGPG